MGNYSPETHFEDLPDLEKQEYTKDQEMIHKMLLKDTPFADLSLPVEVFNIDRVVKTKIK